VVPFQSILFDRSDAGRRLDEGAAREFLADLRLDHVIDSITDDRDEYDLRPLFLTPLSSVDSINYRQDVFRDLEDPALAAHVRAFSKTLRSMREHLAEGELLSQYQKLRWFAAAVGMYCDAVTELTNALATTNLQSQGFLGLREYLDAYAQSAEFAALVAETKKITAELASIRYRLHISADQARVARATDRAEVDYAAEIDRVFERFRTDSATEYSFTSPVSAAMSELEGAVLDTVAQLYPRVFAGLERYTDRQSGYLDATIAAFDREIHFYLEYLAYIGELQAGGLPFCYPVVSADSKAISAHAAFDLALAHRLRNSGAIVTNDFSLDDPERILVITGPNQSGKTTFARMFGQLHFLARLGLPVPGRDAKVLLTDNVFTHFQRQEWVENQRSELEIGLLHVHEILERATANSLIVLNEVFISTSLSDALLLNRAVLARVSDLDALCVCVTFLDELSTLNEKTVSMVGSVDPDDPAVRTYKVVRRPANGLAYAAAIAAKYELSYEGVKRRIRA
jgi:DNA mismatch repair ATPase MutS